jgi:hypothetical protein
VALPEALRREAEAAGGDTKQFRVFTHPTLGLEAVKVGVSWPGFFFTAFWMATKKLWARAGLWIGAALVLTLFERIADSSPEGGAQAVLYLITAGGWLALGLVPLFKGNGWREANLKARGYEAVSTIDAATADAAIAQAAKAVAEGATVTGSSTRDV